MTYGSDSYAPITLPHMFNILTPSGVLMNLGQLSQSLRDHGALTTGDAELDAAVTLLGSPDRDEVGLVCSQRSAIPQRRDQSEVGRRVVPLRQ